MNGVIVLWSDPPSPEALANEKSYSHYHAGQTYQCRCLALPLADLSEVSWPAKYYSNGKIQYITRAKFTKLAGFPMAA